MKVSPTASGLRLKRNWIRRKDALCESILYLSKLSINSQLEGIKPRVRELISYSIRLFDYLEGRFDVSRQKYVPFRVLEGRINDFLDNIMISTLQEAGYPGQIPYDTEELIRCSQTTDLVLPTLNLVGSLKQIWKEKVIYGLREYAWIYRMLGLTMTYLNSQPLPACQLGLNRLVQGCSDDFVGPDKLLTVGHFCPNYCSNVLRGCLAPPLLFWPMEMDGSDLDEQGKSQTPWQRLLASPRQGPARNQIQAAFDQLLSSLNATGLMNLISLGLQNAHQDLRRIVKELELFCGDGVLRKKQLAVEPPEIPDKINDEQSTAEIKKRQEELVEFMRSLGQRLTTLARELTDVDQYVYRIEERFCRSGSKQNQATTVCWNGTHYGRYDKPVAPFTQDGQFHNPEVPFNGKKHQSYTVVNRPLEVERPLSDPDQSVPSSQISLPTWPDLPDSSGFSPESEDELIRLPQSLNEAMNFPPVFPDLPSPQPKPVMEPNLVGGCSPDDEDCLLPGQHESQASITFNKEAGSNQTPGPGWMESTSTTSALNSTSIIKNADVYDTKGVIPRTGTSSDQTSVVVAKKGEIAPILPNRVLITTGFALFYVSYFRYFSDSNTSFS
ncbi:hypothetical protein T265_14276 [Opisthorchis viverrini]|uniref:Glypican n=1 Tax=Opisthorchis viverrini TaxID=6198 RepID=A0A074ZD33_OPIVI|nr:hypothetical protein T265_14276 [Opisthorchis viverrini]KER25098.1 hypothetical protein T265_14276 [Opisthorchis viverrini]